MVTERERDLDSLKTNTTSISKEREDSYRIRIGKLGFKPKKFYIIFILNIIFGSVLLWLLFYLKVKMLYVFLIMLFYIPVFILSFLFLIIRTYLDRKRIKTALVRKLAKNYIVAKFFTKNKRLEEYAIMLDRNSRTFKYDKGLYTLDLSCVFPDQDDRPCAFYFKGIPNPLKFNFDKYLEQFEQNIRRKTQTKDWDGKEIEVAYSSETLIDMSKDKFFHELHTSNQIGDTLKYIVIVVAMFLIGFVLMAIFMK